MKTKLRRLLACVLALFMLSGCSALGRAEDVFSQGGGLNTKAVTGRENGMVSFDEMVYERPDLEALRAAVSEVEEGLDSGLSYSKIREMLDNCYEQYYHFYTMYNLSDIRSCQDLTDEYYAAEYQWCSENFSVVQQLFDEMYYACAASSLGETLEEKYFWDGFLDDYSDESESIYSDAVVALMQQESALLSEYRALMANPTVEREGSEVDYFSTLPELEGEDYNRTVIAYYTKYNEQFADLYIRLVDVRSRMAEEMGFDNYEQMQYVYYFERDYTPEQAAVYTEGIKNVVVPYYRELMETAPYADVWYDLVPEELLYELLAQAAEEIGGDVAKAFRFMSKYELYDISVSYKKAAMSFQTYLTDYDAPFLFLDATGDTEDILAFAHEFGHYTDAFVNYDSYETIDLAECYSQAMEYLILSRLGSSMEEEDVENIARLKMLDTLELYVQQAAFAEFESRVYALGAENLSAEVLNDLSREVAVEYGYYDADYDEFYALGWTDITHFFEIPFYVITYPVSNDIAMQIFAMEKAEPGSGMKKYLKILPRDFSGLMELVDAGKFESPFDEGRLESIVDLMKEYFET